MDKKAKGTDGRRGKLERRSVKVTKQWIEDYCKERLNDKHYRILKIIAKNRLVRSDQIANFLWKGKKRAQRLANKKLRELYDLHCIDRHFPYTQHGTTKQHLVLDKAGAKVLEIKGFRKLETLPISYRHYILNTEFRMLARRKGFNWGKLNQSLQINKNLTIRPDIFYPKKQIAVEIDRGTEVYSTLEKKAAKYNLLKRKGVYEKLIVVFVTTGSSNRSDEFHKMLDSNLSKMTGKFSDSKRILMVLKNQD